MRGISYILRYAQDRLHDSLYHLTAADYSTGEAFEYQYDAVGNRIIITSTTPLSGTVITTHTFDAVNRFIARTVSDGRAYTYTWSARGQMLAEYTGGVPVREFTYDGAGRMIRARVFTQTTEFVYNGLGDRVAVHVDGYGAITYVLDYAAGNRILAETTPTSTVSYLYGHDCLGEFRDGEPLYYLPDAEGYVRQGVDADSAVVSAWLFDPDGTVLEGPSGPVSHLVCGGVYDGSTGLLYKGGRYFDPALGIWLVLLPLMVVQVWPGWKKRQGTHPWMVLTLCLIGVSGMLAACGTCRGPSIDPPSACAEVVSFGQPLGNNAVFVGPPAGSQLPEYPEAITWDPAERQVVEETLTNVLDNKFGGSTGFGSLNATLTEFCSFAINK